MSLFRRLASQTALYGLSSMLGRFLNYLLVPLYTYNFSAGEYGVVSEFYAYAGFFAVVSVFGLETAYFRFRQRDGYVSIHAPEGANLKEVSPLQNKLGGFKPARSMDDSELVYGRALTVLILGNALLFGALWLGQHRLAVWLHYPDHPEYIAGFAAIFALDAISALPFARLRAENRVWRFVSIRLAEIFLNLGLNLFFLGFCKQWPELWSSAMGGVCYDPSIGVGYIFFANLIASAGKLLLLTPQLRFSWHASSIPLIKPLLAYASPMVVIGLAGLVNEMLDRALLKYWLPYDMATNLRLLGIYSACYKLAMLMSLFIQAFRYAGEPFFFAYAGRADAPRAYARVMEYFIIFCVGIFLLVALNLHVLKYFIGAEFREGLDVVPILLLANLCLGIYVNLSIWYKLTDHTGLGAWVALSGALLTVVLNVYWIPVYGYRGAAWATLLCYASMAVLSYGLGRIYYPVPYRLSRCLGYPLFGLVLYVAHLYGSTQQALNPWLSSSAALLIFSGSAAWLEWPRPRKAASSQQIG